MHHYASLFKIFSDYKQFQIFILGLFSGIPLAIIYTTIIAWLKLSGIDIAIVTFFAISRVFYSLKFFWAPFVDQVKIPLIYRLGRRKSWISICFAVIALIIFSYSLMEPKTSLFGISVLTICLGFTSSTLDIAIDAFRIDNIEKEKLSLAAANAVFGYRIGMLIAGAGAFFIAEDYGWSIAFKSLSGLYIIGIFFLFTLKEFSLEQKVFNFINLHSWKIATVDPFIDFFNRRNSLVILLAVIFYKLGDAMLGVVATPFYLELGFSLKEIAIITKIFGVIATIFGAYIGGIIMYKYGNIKGLIISAISQSITNLAFIWLHHQGHNTNALMTAIAVENIASGMGDAALVGYLSYLCNKRFSATQYALLSSASGLFSHSIVVFGGSLVKILGWDAYFVMTILLAIPGLLILLYLKNKET